MKAYENLSWVANGPGRIYVNALNADPRSLIPVFQERWLKQ